MVAWAVSVLALPFAVSAQGAFDVASVKPNNTGSTGWSISYSADSWRAANSTLAAMIQSAYGIREDRLVGGPAWVRTTRFDVNAKAAEALPREQLRLMARQLLEQRFGVVLRKEEREEQVYAMRLARSDGRTGPDLRRSSEGCLENPSPRTTPKSSTGSVPQYSGWCATLTSLATGLSRYLQAEVVDQTGLPGRWDFTLAFADPSPNAVPSVEAAQANLPTIFAAVEEQLGFRLERDARGVVEYVSIAAAQPPAQN